MAPPRARNLDDSRSETSSTITNQKDKSALGGISSVGVFKGKRSGPGQNATQGGTKTVVNGNTTAAAAAALLAAAPLAVVNKDPDPSLPRVSLE